jgi:prolyl 4-hydroxylase
MASVPKLSSVITWILYFIPVYIFVLEPILRPLLPGRSETSGATNRENEIWGSEIPLEEWETEPAFLLEDESRISPEDGVPTNCPGEAPGYKLHLLSRTPLIIYIENFVSDEEADHLVDSR